MTFITVSRLLNSFISEKRILDRKCSRVSNLLSFLRWSVGKLEYVLWQCRGSSKRRGLITIVPDWKPENIFVYNYTGKALDHLNKICILMTYYALLQKNECEDTTTIRRELPHIEIHNTWLSEIKRDRYLSSDCVSLLRKYNKQSLIYE